MSKVKPHNSTSSFNHRFMKAAGKVLLVGAALLGFYSIVLFDPSVSAGETRVVNLHRLSLQQNLTIVAVGLGIIGALLLLFGSKREVNDDGPHGTSTPFSRVDDANLSVEEQFAEAIRNEDLATVRRYLSNRSISAHGRNRNGRGWLQYATAVGSIQAAKVILEHGASPRDKDEIGRSALEEAEARSSKELISLFSQTASSGRGSAGAALHLPDDRS